MIKIFLFSASNHNALFQRRVLSLLYNSFFKSVVHNGSYLGMVAINKKPTYLSIGPPSPASRRNCNRTM